MQSDGKLLFRDYNGGYLHRLKEDGTADLSFGDGGRLAVPGVIVDLVVQSDDKIVLVTAAKSYSILRLNPDGSPDQEFATAGQLVLTHSEYYLQLQAREALNPRLVIRTSPDGGDRITAHLSAKHLATRREVAVVVQADQSGNLDPEFGNNGIAEVDFRGEMAVDHSGNIFLARLAGRDLQAVRLLSNGSVDAGFVLDLPLLGSVDDLGVPHGAALLPNILLHADAAGGLVVVGTRFVRNESPLTVLRFDETGEFDWGFSDAATDLGNSLAPYWYDAYKPVAVANGSFFVANYFNGAMLEISSGESSQPVPPAVSFRVEATDLLGTPVNRVTVDEEFRLNVYVSDLRAEAHGVFAAYVDVVMDGGEVYLIDEITIGDQFPNGRSSAYHTNSFDDVGGFGGVTVPPPGELLLFSATVRTDAVGTITIGANPADESPGHDVLLHGRGSQAVESRETIFGRLSLESTAVRWHNSANKYDVDSDGMGSALDALAVINDVNTNGARLLPDRYTGTPYYLDVNRDDYASAADVLEIVDMLNFGPGETAEAEGEFAIVWEPTNPPDGARDPGPPASDPIPLLSAAMADEWARNPGPEGDWLREDRSVRSFPAPSSSNVLLEPDRFFSSLASENS